MGFHGSLWKAGAADPQAGTQQEGTKAQIPQTAVQSQFSIYPFYPATAAGHNYVWRLRLCYWDSKSCYPLAMAPSNTLPWSRQTASKNRNNKITSKEWLRYANQWHCQVAHSQINLSADTDATACTLAGSPPKAIQHAWRHHLGQ